MNQITLNIPPNALNSAKEIARNTNREVEDVLVEWIDQGAASQPVQSLSDDQLLKLCESQMEPSQQKQLSALLEKNRENQLTTEDKQELERLMTLYRQGLLRKAEAYNEAVQRGLHINLQ